MRRHVHGASVDDPVVTYEGSSVTSSLARRLIADRQGSIVGLANSSGTILNRNMVDPYGVPMTSAAGENVSGRFGYTGQTWIPELGLWHYKARLYSPTLGQFLQTDPIGYEDQINLYAYVGNDPVSRIDPTGMAGCDADPSENIDCSEIIIEAPRLTDKQKAVLTAVNVVLAFTPGGEAENCAFLRICTTEEKAWAAIDLIPGFCKVGKGRHLQKLLKACGCVVAGTLVATPKGLTPIEDIVVGDLVLAFNPETGEISNQIVTDTIKTVQKPTFDVVLRSSGGEVVSFRSTDDHQWLKMSRAWVQTDKLHSGDLLVAGKDPSELYTVMSITRSGTTETAYTLTVNALHTYMIGESGLIAHNDCKLPPDLDTKRFVRLPGEQGYKEKGTGHIWQKDNSPRPHGDPEGGTQWKVKDSSGRVLETRFSDGRLRK